MSSLYHDELAKIMSDTSPPPSTTQLRAEIEADIANITARLKGHMDNGERLTLVEARSNLCKLLAVATA